ncbi:MAG: hypothetical protein HY943_09090 [Gammaproteobacteria bacterium]|nr:hypothetical protein [Gammaproteobacteria bacterium]
MSRTGTFPRLFLAFATVLAGCSEPTDESLFPLTPGRNWYYQARTVVRDEPHAQRIVIANTVAKDVPGAKLATQRRQMAWDYYFKETERGIFRIGSTDRRENGPRTAEEEVMILPHDVKEGSSWRMTSRLELVESRTFSADDRIVGRYYPVHLTARVAARDESVKVPAGSFAHCVRVDATGETSVRVDRGYGTAPVKVTQQDWYAPGVGLVKSTRLEHSDSTFLRPGTYDQELVSFER